ncbi:GTP cyclohydrolase I [Yinghuangia sp. ASG 101]|uniref:GTP cyclohydrolase I n=1 Tax=Yinghuangia sp. ASG 101 TaxID=2896848 RepID=UPI001E5D124A|nr:GTP cyclohydrolase I [Yinghuangia sp. ASG 101]UGQ10961.1 GTP cyclohydrolase I [Yinghuangia sp. ASG 101]
MPSNTTAGRDLDRAESAAAQMLAAIGVDLAAPGLARTPRRLVNALVEMTTPEAFEPTVFEPVDGHNGLVIVDGIRFTSLCEHHMLPFTGTAHVGYLPRKTLLGLSKFPRVVNALAKSPQVQERLTVAIADWIAEHLAPAGVGVLMHADHTCMTLRGACAHGARTTTSALRGVLLDDVAARAEFMTLAVAR